MIACFLSNISAKYYKNPSMLSRVIAKNVGDVFLRHCTSGGSSLGRLDDYCAMTATFVYTSLFTKMVTSTEKTYIQKYTINKNGSRNKEK